MSIETEVMLYQLAFIIIAVVYLSALSINRHQHKGFVIWPIPTQIQNPSSFKNKYYNIELDNDKSI